MIHVFYTPNCNACKKVIKFFRDNQIPIHKIQIGVDFIEHKMLVEILSICENGFETILSFKTDSSKRMNLNRENYLNLTSKEVMGMIENDLNFLKRPLIYQTDKAGNPYRIQTGYDPEEITIFLRGKDHW